MSANTSAPSLSFRKASCLRRGGYLVLLLGVVAAGLLYGLETRSVDSTDELSMSGLHRAQQRQMGLLYGDMGQVLLGWYDDLKQPGTQAAIILGFSVVIAGGCFLAARAAANNDESL